MADALSAAQTLFYLVVSFAIIVLGVLFGVAALHLVRLSRNLEKISENMKDATDEVRENIDALLGALRRIPFLSFLFRKGRKRNEKEKNA